MKMTMSGMESLKVPSLSSTDTLFFAIVTRVSLNASPAWATISVVLSIPIIEIANPRNAKGTSKLRRFIPFALSASISFSLESLPSTTIVERRNAMGNVNVR